MFGFGNQRGPIEEPIFTNYQDYYVRAHKERGWMEKCGKWIQCPSAFDLKIHHQLNYSRGRSWYGIKRATPVESNFRSQLNSAKVVMVWDHKFEKFRSIEVIHMT